MDLQLTELKTFVFAVMVSHAATLRGPSRGLSCPLKLRRWPQSSSRIVRAPHGTVLHGLCAC